MKNIPIVDFDRLTTEATADAPELGARCPEQIAPTAADIVPGSTGLDYFSGFSAGLLVLKVPTRPILLNMTNAEIEVLVSPLDRALALTWSELDLADEHTRELIRSVNGPEAGEKGVALQHLLKRGTKPAPRPRRKPALKPVSEAVRRETRGNLFEVLAEEEKVLTASGVDAEEAGAEVTDVLTGAEILNPDTKIPVVPPVAAASVAEPDAEETPDFKHREVTPSTPDAGAPQMNLGARLLVLLTGRIPGADSH